MQWPCLLFAIKCWSTITKKHIMCEIPPEKNPAQTYFPATKHPYIMLSPPKCPTLHVFSKSILHSIPCCPQGRECGCKFLKSPTRKVATQGETSTYVQISQWMDSVTTTAQTMKFSITSFFSKCNQIPKKLRIWSHLLKKSVMENLIFCAVHLARFLEVVYYINDTTHWLFI